MLKLTWLYWLYGWKVFWRCRVGDSEKLNNFSDSHPYTTLSWPLTGKHLKVGGITVSLMLMLAGGGFSVPFGLPACTWAISINFFLPHWSPFHHLLNILIFSHAQTHHSLCGVSACGPLCLIISILVTLSSQLIPITLFTRAFQRHSAWSECFTLRKIVPISSFAPEI